MTAVDYVIVGGGVVGCAVGWALARRGREVVVLEAGAVASGASGGPGLRGVRANGRDPRELPLARRAQDLWPDLDDVLGRPTGFARTGHLQLTERPDDEELAATVERQRVAGIATEWVEAGRLRELEPGVAPEVVGAVRCPDDGVADHTATTRAYAGALQAEGGVIRDGTRVVEWVPPRTAVSSEAEVFEWTAGVLVAANAGILDLVGGLGIAAPLFNVFPQVLVTAPVRPAPVHHVVGHAHRRLAVKMLRNGGVMVTGGWLGRDGIVDPDQVAGNLEEAVAVFPALAGVEVSAADASRAENICADMVPIVDRLPGLDAAWVAAGWSGHGWAIAPAVAEALAGWMVSGQRPDVLAPFGLDRFGATPG